MKTYEKISKHLQDRGQTQKWLARQVGVSEKRISLWLKGTGRIPPEPLRLIAEALAVPLDYLSDPGMAEPPEPIVTADELAIVRQIRYWGLSREQAIDLLSRTPHVGGTGRPVVAIKPDGKDPEGNKPKPSDRKAKR